MTRTPAQARWAKSHSMRCLCSKSCSSEASGLLPLSTACCGYGSGDTGLPVVPHHGVAVRTQGVLCVTGLGYATTGPRFGPGPVSWKPPSRGNPQTTACCGGGSCGKLRKKGPSCDFSTNVRVSFERMRERVSNECVRESFARMEIVGFCVTTTGPQLAVEHCRFLWNCLGSVARIFE